jgi:hypothetical protein
MLLLSYAPSGIDVEELISALEQSRLREVIVEATRRLGESTTGQ